MGIFNPWKVRAPGGGVGGGDTAESSLEVLISLLHLALRLWVETRGEAHHDT